MREKILRIIYTMSLLGVVFMALTFETLGLTSLLIGAISVAYFSFYQFANEGR